MQYGYVVAEVLLSYSWERWRLRVSVNHIDVQLCSENKNKWSVRDLLFSFVANVPLFTCMHSLSYYQLKRIKEIVSKIVYCFTIPFSFIFPTEW